MNDIKLNTKNVGTLTSDGWTIWSRKCKSVLQAYGLWTYIKGPNTQPPTDTMKLAEWIHINDHIVGALCQVVDNSLSQEIENLTMEHDAWEHLKMKTYQSGIISKFNALQTAMCTHFTMPDSIHSTIADMKDLTEIIYDKQQSDKLVATSLGLHSAHLSLYLLSVLSYYSCTFVFKIKF